jgi:solute carrier family 4 (sodium bicarbonate transporter), member 10
MIGVRKMLDYVFTKEELKILDDILPEFTRREKLEIEEEIEKEVSIFLPFQPSLMFSSKARAFQN